jgi:hypothetical protein
VRQSGFEQWLLPLLFIGLWFVMSRYLLPRLGIST